ncbi:MAG TPA: gluconeogenesis factor YvcK family protein [Candidatus Dormibacteraeota bacterium]|nr:gluconeogenesis factor YvcK family protein [Candidatus Dormibacteraeota bacterium]
MRSRIITGAQWILPGFGIKRWMLVALLGLFFLLDAADRIIVAQGLHFRFDEALDAFVVDVIPPALLTSIFIALGLIFFSLGMVLSVRAVARSARGRRNDPLGTLRRLKLAQGYKIVAVGGGTGLSTLLRGLKVHTSNLTAVVTVSDDGGSSGRLQKELGVLPPGDIRNCLVALADDEALVTDLFRYRFELGDGLEGHSFGNLFLAAMTGITGNFDSAIKESSRVLSIIGRVLPSTLGYATLCARLDDGSTMRGESAVGMSGRPIVELFFDPPRVKPLDEVIDAIREADAIVLGPGSLYTSILPNLLVERIAQEISAAHGVKIYICNVMTQPGETTGMSASEHLAALARHSGARLCDYAIINAERPKRLLDAYAGEGQIPVEIDDEAIRALGVEPIRASVISESEHVRHDPERLADAVIETIDRVVALRASLIRRARNLSE